MHCSVKALGNAQNNYAKHSYNINIWIIFTPDATDEEVQEMAPVLVNGSPKLPRLPMPSALDHESFDITLHRKDTEGFGFVILTSKSKPPHGGESQVSQILHQYSLFLISLTKMIQSMTPLIS